MSQGQGTNHTLNTVLLERSGEATNEPTGSTLVFKFVRMDGTKAQWDSILSTGFRKIFATPKH